MTEESPLKRRCQNDHPSTATCAASSSSPRWKVRPSATGTRSTSKKFSAVSTAHTRSVPPSATRMPTCVKSAIAMSSVRDCARQSRKSG
ncbi:MAG: hypothetical protein A2085_06555 [Gemmatimonadetes bacterium GWC2_71_10]|nr:MAG: hypothetical protein A2085_06555 [Gemmatimonadetes bacterium GWC2_71_10]